MNMLKRTQILSTTACALLTCAQAFLITTNSAAHSEAAYRPPTVDPTYGLPLPPAAKSSSAVKAPTDLWIWTATTKENQDVSFRRSFTLSKRPSSAAIYITADDRFTLYINGVQAAAVAPGTVDAWKSVQKLDVAQYLTTGRNVIAVQVHNDVAAAGLLLRLELPGLPNIKTDADWKTLESDAMPAGWTAAGFDDTDWLPAVQEAVAGQGAWNTQIVGWPGVSNVEAPYLAHMELPVTTITAVENPNGITGQSSILGNKDGVVTLTVSSSDATAPAMVVDFGREVAGRLAITGLTTGTVSVGLGESQLEAVKVPWHGPVNLNLTPGSTSYTDYSAFRYARIVLPKPQAGTTTVKLQIALDHKYYPVEYKGSFDCSDPLLTKLWYTGAYTSHLCMQEDIWDAPKRDRWRWAGDLHVSAEVINDVFADKFLMEQTLDGLREDSQSGRPYTEPAAKDLNGIPGYSAAYICTLADFYRHTGDLEYIKRHREELLGLLTYMQQGFDADNMFANKHGEWVYTDWSPGFDNGYPGSIACTDLFTARAVGDAVFLLKEAGDTANAAKYATWQSQIVARARQTLPANDTYGNRLQENAMAVYSGIATPGQYSKIFDSVLSPDSDSWDKTGSPPYNNGLVSPYYGNYVIQALCMTGHTTSAESVLRSYWGGMMAEGATTFWELYDPYWPKADFHEHIYNGTTNPTQTSLCHGWSSGPTSMLTDWVLGVRPTGGGFKTVDIAPDLGDLTWAAGNVPTPRGPIHVRAQKTSNGLTVNLTIPPGTTATVTVPGRVVKSSPAVKIISLPGQTNGLKTKLLLTKAGKYIIQSVPVVAH